MVSGIPNSSYLKFIYSLIESNPLVCPVENPFEQPSTSKLIIWGGKLPLLGRETFLTRIKTIFANSEYRYPKARGFSFFNNKIETTRWRLKVLPLDDIPFETTTLIYDLGVFADILQTIKVLRGRGYSVEDIDRL
jgi:hypothetical protein